jgi:hypothetical protein
LKTHIDKHVNITVEKKLKSAATKVATVKKTTKKMSNHSIEIRCFRKYYDL